MTDSTPNPELFDVMSTEIMGDNKTRSLQDREEVKSSLPQIPISEHRHTADPTEDDAEKQLCSDEANEERSEASDSPSGIVDFDGPDDPNNPYNWSKSKKWAHGGVLSIMSFIT
jgi:hypothetical protein